MHQVGRAFDDRWIAGPGAYAPVADDYSVAVNAAMLQVHAVAAAGGVSGPARRDERARILVRRLTTAPVPFLEQASQGLRTDKMLHAPGWTSSLAVVAAKQDKAIDPQVAAALLAAWRAADVLGLTAEERAMVADRIFRCAHAAFFRFPSVRLNQINWNAELHAASWEVTGDVALLQQDYRSYALRFLRHIAKPQRSQRVGNLGPGYHFHYLPHEPPHHPYNIHSSEYANETLCFLAQHQAGLAAGMKPWPDWAHERARAWVTRTLCGDWAHSGFLSWDTGLGPQRWMVGKVWAFAQQGLLAIARASEFHADQRYAGWARWMLDRGFDLYERWSAAEPTGMAPPTLHGLALHPQGESSRSLFAARMAANAAQAISSGVGAIAPLEPPALASVDPDSGRVTFTTRAYSTALVGARQRALPYGGLDPVRLIDGAGTALTTIGGRGTANITAIVHDRRWRVVLKSAARATAGRPDKVVLVGERGERRIVRRDSAGFPSRPYAGPVTAVETEGRVARDGITLRARHRFAAGGLELRWRAEGGGRAHRLAAQLPLRDGGTATAVLRSGERVALATGAMGPQLADVAHIEIDVPGGGQLVVVVLRAPRGTTASLIGVRPQAASPGVRSAVLLAPARPSRGPHRLEVRLVPRAAG